MKIFKHIKGKGFYSEHVCIPTPTFYPYHLTLLALDLPTLPSIHQPIWFFCLFCFLFYQFAHVINQTEGVWQLIVQRIVFVLTNPQVARVCRVL